MRPSLYLLAGFLPAMAWSQPLFNTSEFGLLGSVAIPSGDFGDNGSGNGNAATGWGIGADFIAHFSRPYLAWTTTFLYLQNGIDIDAPSGVEVPDWLNIPLVTGVRVQTMQTNPIRGYGQMQLGINFATQTDYEEPGRRIEVDWTQSLGLVLGAGAILWERFHVGLRYFHLGKPEYTLRYRSEIILQGKQEPRILALLLGFNFDATN